MQAEDKELLKKFLYGDCTPEENQRVQELLQMPGAEEIMQELTLEEWNEPDNESVGTGTADECIAGNRGSSKTDSIGAENEIKTIVSSWKEKLNNRIAEDNSRNQKGWFKLFPLRYAAVWAGLLLIGFLAAQQFKKTNYPESITYIQKINRQNKPVKYLLPDSSEVYLGSGSRLKYPVHFTGKTRELTLKGEAFFQVKHNVRKPFIIHTGEIQTQVLGTSFKVQAFDQQNVVVAVATGKVGVSRHTAKVSATLALLTPGHSLKWNGKTGQAVEGLTDISGLQQWTSGDMIFDEQPLSEIALELERRYHVHLDFVDQSVARHQLSGTFPAGKPIHKIMKALAAAGKFQYERTTDNLYKIYQPKQGPM